MVRSSRRFEFLRDRDKWSRAGSIPSAKISSPPHLLAPSGIDRATPLYMNDTKVTDAPECQIRIFKPR